MGQTMPFRLSEITTSARIRVLFASALGVMAALLFPAPGSAGEYPADGLRAKAAPANAARVVFAGGCFWGVQAVFEHTKGVLSAVSGYAGGSVPNPAYEEVSSGTTGHAEAVEVTYYPNEISFDRLLEIFFKVAHDPTELNRQGPDEGSQYRSAIFTTSPAQQLQAKEFIAGLEEARIFHAPIVTNVEPLKAFYRAEAYHQDYAARHPGNIYILAYDRPKIANLKRLYPDVYRDEPALVARLRE